jgi:hypothetical protein
LCTFSFPILIFRTRHNCARFSTFLFHLPYPTSYRSYTVFHYHTYIPPSHEEGRSEAEWHCREERTRTGKDVEEDEGRCVLYHECYP